MTEYKKEIYPLENKSGDDIQHYGFIIYIDGTPSIRQWHKPKAMGYVFMKEEEANQEADEMILEFGKDKEINIKQELSILKMKIHELENNI